MKKIFMIAAIAAMFAFTSCSCGNSKQVVEEVDNTTVECVVDSTSTETVDVAPEVQVVSE